MQVTLLKKNQFIKDTRIPGENNLSAIKEFLGDDFKEYTNNLLLDTIGGAMLYRKQCLIEDSKEPTLIFDDNGNPSKVIFGEILLVGKDTETGEYHSLSSVDKLILATTLQHSGAYKVTNPATKECSYCFTLRDLPLAEENDATS